MVTVAANLVKPSGYIGRHIAYRPSRPRLVQRVKNWLFGEEPEGMTMQGLNLPPVVKVLDGITGRVADDVEAYMKPYVAELDAIMARFRTGLAAI